MTEVCDVNRRKALRELVHTLRTCTAIGRYAYQHHLGFAFAIFKFPGPRIPGRRPPYPIQVGVIEARFHQHLRQSPYGACCDSTHGLGMFVTHAARWGFRRRHMI